MPITSALTGYVRGQVSLYGDSKNDPANSVDDYDGYELLNLYVGVRDASGAWEVGLYGKNVTETERVLTRSSTVASTPFNLGATASSGLTNYYAGGVAGGLVMTAPREFGLSVRYSFGSN
jgi:iron complex outermembrane receptor protein